MLLLAEDPKSSHNATYWELRHAFSPKRFAALRGPDGLQENFDNLATKADMMTADEKAVVVVVTTVSIEDEFATLLRRLKVRRPEPARGHLGQ